MAKKSEKFHPWEANLGKDCIYWQLDTEIPGCNSINLKVLGRISCAGTIDDVCLYRSDNLELDSLSPRKKEQINKTPIDIAGNRSLPPGRIK